MGSPRSKQGRRHKLGVIAVGITVWVLGLGACGSGPSHLAASHGAAAPSARRPSARPPTARPPSAAPATASTTAAPTTAAPTSAAPTSATATANPAPLRSAAGPAPAPTSRPVPTTAAACPASVASRLASTGSASQLVVVEAPSTNTTYATVTLWQRQGRCWVAAGGPWPGRLGAGGFSDHHREGDNTTPTGIYGIGPVIYGNAADPGVSYPYHRLVCGDWWDEDPTSPAYNSFQHVNCGQAPPFGGGSEALWQETAAYPSFAVVDYNTDPVVAYAGSAIFIHADIGSPTAGCVSVPLTDLDQLLRWLKPAGGPLVVMGPQSEIARF